MTSSHPAKTPGAGERKRVFLVDDHELVRDGISEVIRKSRSLMVCGVASTAGQALRNVSSARADLAIVDLSLEGTSGLDLIKSLKTRHPDLPVLVLSMHDESFYAERALRAGARGYIMKKEAIGALLDAVERVIAGEIYLSPNMSRSLLPSTPPGGGPASVSPEADLSDRELEVLTFMGQGCGASDIAARLSLSVKTIETYQLRIREKLSLKDAGELLKHAIRWVASRGGPA